MPPTSRQVDDCSQPAVALAELGQVAQVAGVDLAALSPTSAPPADRHSHLRSRVRPAPSVTARRADRAGAALNEDSAHFASVSSATSGLSVRPAGAEQFHGSTIMQFDPRGAFCPPIAQACPCAGVEWLGRDHDDVASARLATAASGSNARGPFFLAPPRPPAPLEQRIAVRQGIAASSSCPRLKDAEHGDLARDRSRRSFLIPSTGTGGTRLVSRAKTASSMPGDAVAPPKRRSTCAGTSRRSAPAARIRRAGNVAVDQLSDDLNTWSPCCSQSSSSRLGRRSRVAGCFVQILASSPARGVV